VKGLSETPSMQRTFLEQALMAAPADDRIRLGAWQVHTNGRSPARAGCLVGGAGVELHFREARYLSALHRSI
jgi:hypothetical protein